MQAKSALNIHINFSSLVRFLTYDSNASVAYTRANIRRDTRPLEARIARTSCGLSRDALNFIVIYLVCIVHSNKDNKAIWKTVGLNRALNFRLPAV